MNPFLLYSFLAMLQPFERLSSSILCLNRRQWVLTKKLKEHGIATTAWDWPVRRRLHPKAGAVLGALLVVGSIDKFVGQLGHGP